MRPQPFNLIFGALADERFPAIRDALQGETRLDAFLLSAPALELLRDLRPDTGVGDAADAFVALVHAAYLYWHDGTPRRELDAAATGRLLDPAAAGPGAAAGDVMPGTTYIQVAPRRIWGRLADEATFEPLDGWFARARGGRLEVVACFGVHPERPGVTVVSASGPPPMAADLVRRDGTAAFAATMPGGAAAGLAEVGSPGELLALAWRAARPAAGT